MSDKMGKKRARGSSSTAEEEDKILEKLTSIQTRIDDSFTKMENELAALKRDFKQDISAIRSELSEVVKSIESAWTKISALEENEFLKAQMATTLFIELANNGITFLLPAATIMKQQQIASHNIIFLAHGR